MEEHTPGFLSKLKSNALEFLIYDTGMFVQNAS